MSELMSFLRFFVIKCSLFLLAIGLLSCESRTSNTTTTTQDSTTMQTQTTTATPKAIEVFMNYIVGDFDNQTQVAEELKAGKQVHPYAKHVSRRADAKIKHLPAQYNGFYLLEESYYLYPNQPDTLVKPYLFFFEAVDDQTVRLHSMQLPKEMDLKQIKNANESLTFDYDMLKESPTFKPANYTWTSKGFYIKAPNEFPNGSFTLEETISEDRLEVMETLIKDGKQVTPYNTPLQYVRIKY